MQLCQQYVEDFEMCMCKVLVKENVARELFEQKKEMICWYSRTKPAECIFSHVSQYQIWKPRFQQLRLKIVQH